MVNQVTLLALPVELRLMIYQFIFEEEHRSIIRQSFGEQVRVSASRRLRFLLTCRRIYDEAWVIAFRNHVFRVRIKEEEGLDWREAFPITRFTRAIPWVKLSEVRHLMLDGPWAKLLLLDRRPLIHRFRLETLTFAIPLHFPECDIAISLNPSYLSIFGSARDRVELHSLQLGFALEPCLKRDMLKQVNMFYVIKH